MNNLKEILKGCTINNADYHKSTQLSFSKLKAFIDNAVYYNKKYIRREVEEEDKDYFTIGSYFHTAVLEPQKIEEEFLELDCVLSTKAGIAEAIKTIDPNCGDVRLEGSAEELRQLFKESKLQLRIKKRKQIITRANAAIARMLAAQANKIDLFDIAQKNLTLQDLLSKYSANCYIEKAFYATLACVAVQCKPDLLIETAQGIIAVDLKSTVVTSAQACYDTCKKYLYNYQAGFYTQILEANGVPISNFLFIFAGKEYSDGFLVACKNAHLREDYKKWLEVALTKYKNCLETGVWENYALVENKLTKLINI